MDWRRTAITVLGALAAAAAASGAGSFDEHFEDATLRVDLYQFGDAEHEHAAVDRLIRQGAWAGPVDLPVAADPVGRYVAKVVDPDTGEVLFELAFDSLFGEYRTTAAAAAGEVRVFHESVLLPFPRRPVRLTLGRRPADGDELLLVETLVDPDDDAIAVEPPATGATVVDVHVVGDPHDSLDIVFVGEGYTAGDLDRFRTDLREFSDLILTQEPYAGRRDRINIRGVVLPSVDEGCDEPTRGRWRDTAVGASFNTLGSPRYLLTEANRGLRDIAANAPYDTLVIMVNHDRYGGGGIFNRYCTFTAHGAFAGYLLLHELGHSFGGLADEYYTSSTAYDEFYPPGVEPAEANLSSTAERSLLKWADLVEPDTPLPTPWDKERYDREDLAYQQTRRELDDAIAAAARSGAFRFEIELLRETAEAHALARVAAVDEFMSASGELGTVGAFEGAGYVSRGLYRPSIDCLMFSRGVKPLCPVCRRAVGARIDRLSGSRR